MGKKDTRGTGSTVENGGQSRFIVLLDVNEDVSYDLEDLKQKIRNISHGSSSKGHEMAQIKLEKGKSTRNGVGSHQRKETTVNRKAQSSQKAFGRPKPRVDVVKMNRSGPLQELDRNQVASKGRSPHMT